MLDQSRGLHPAEHPQGKLGVHALSYHAPRYQYMQGGLGYMPLVTMPLITSTCKAGWGANQITGFGSVLKKGAKFQIVLY